MFSWSDEITDILILPERYAITVLSIAASLAVECTVCRSLVTHAVFSSQFQQTKNHNFSYKTTISVFELGMKINTSKSVGKPRIWTNKPTFSEVVLGHICIIFIINISVGFSSKSCILCVLSVKMLLDRCSSYIATFLRPAAWGLSHYIDTVGLSSSKIAS